MIGRQLLRTLGRRVRAVFAGVGTTAEALVPGPHVHGYRLDDPETWRALHSGDASPITAAVQRCGTPGGGERRNASTAPAAGHPSSAGPPAAGDDPAGLLPPDPAGSPPHDHDTSDLLIAAANQLNEMWHWAHFSSPAIAAYLDELIPELRDRAAQFAAIGD